MKPSLIPSQLFTGLLLLIIAADFSAMHGGWAHELGVPLSAFARYSFWLVPVGALLPCVLPRRIRSWIRVVIGDALALSLAIFPIALFSLGTHSILVSRQQAFPPLDQLRAELGFPVIIRYESNNNQRIYFSHSLNPSQVRDALRYCSTQPNGTQDAASNGG